MQTDLLAPDSIPGNIKDAESYWQEVKSKTDASAFVADKWKMLIPLLEEISSKSSVLVLLWDITTARFIYAIDKRNVVGYNMSLYTAATGISFSAGNIHPDHYDPGMLMTYKGMEYLLENKEPGQNKIICNIDGLYKKSNGDYFHYLQQSVCIESNSDKQPLLFLNYIYDITHLKKEKSANLIITSAAEVKMWNYNFHNKRLEDVQAFSKQEKKVLYYLALGKSSKQIAAELFISPHTVDTHRRNLLERTNCINTTGLITYAKLAGML